MTRSPRFWLCVGTLAYVINFMLVTKADAFVGFWQLGDYFWWLR